MRIPPSTLSWVIQTKLNEARMSQDDFIAEIVKRTDRNPLSIEKTLAGLQIPSDDMSRQICDVLEIPFNVFRKLCEVEREVSSLRRQIVPLQKSGPKLVA